MVSFHPKDKDILRFVNVMGTANMVNACLKVGVRKFCHVSSIAALGRSESDSPVSETDYRTNSKGSSAYSASKYEAELEVWRGGAEGLEVVIVNPSVIIGEGYWDRGSSKLITTVHRGLKFFTRGVNGYVDADDVAKAMIVLMKSDLSGARFILSSEDWSYEKLFKTVAKNLGVVGPSLYASPFMGEIAWRLLALISFFSKNQPLITRDTARNAKSIFRYDASKIINEIGFEFLPIEDSIAIACAEFKKNFPK
jgi:nucleoside-diphosphate-sugar epimerase